MINKQLKQMEAKQMTNLSKFQTASYSYDNTKKSVVGFVEDYVLTWNKIEKYDLVKTMLPETVVFLDVLIQLRNDSIFRLPRGLVVWQVSPLDEVPQRPIFHQSTRIHTFRPWPIFHQSTCIHTIRPCKISHCFVLIDSTYEWHVYSSTNLPSFRFVHFK